MRHPPYRLVFALSIMILGVLHSSLTGAIPERSLWPRLVTITKEVQATLIENGQEIGMAKLRAGKSYKLLDVDESGELLTVDVDGAQALIPVNQTDFTSKTAANAARLAPKEEPSQAPATTVVTSEAVPPVEAESPPAPASPTNHQPLASVTRALEGSLVHLQDGRLIPLNVSTLSGVKYYAIYYSAEWCPPCRKFTPSLVSTYRQLKKGHPELEFIFVSGDRSPKDMESYMKKTGMSFPAVEFSKRFESPLNRFAGGSGIPNLVLIDAEGNVLSSTFVKGRYLGPDTVLNEMKKRFTKK